MLTEKSSSCLSLRHSLSQFNLLANGRCGSNLENVIFKLIMQIDIFNILKKCSHANATDPY